MAKLIEERELQPLQDDVNTPLNGLEVRAALEMEFREWLAGMHHLFNIAKIYPDPAVHFSLAIVIKDEQPMTESKEMLMDSPEEIRNRLTGRLKSSREESPEKADAEIVPQGREAIKISRGYTGSSVTQQVRGSSGQKASE